VSRVTSQTPATADAVAAGGTAGGTARRARFSPRGSGTTGRRSHLFVGIALVIAALLLPVIVQDPQWRQIFVLMLMYAGLASGLNILVGYAGLLDLGFVAFFAVGAYFSALLTVKVVVEAVGAQAYRESWWWLPYVDVIPAALLAGVVAAVLGYPTLRARGDYLAIMTLGLGEIVRLVAINWSGLTGGPPGVRAIPPFAVGDTQLITPVQTYYVSLVIIGGLLFVLWNLRRGHLARVWRVIREDELSAESVGVSARRYKLIAYVGGGFVAGTVGVVFAHGQGFVSPDSFALDLNFIILALVIVGGAGTWFGPILGAVIWVGFDQLVGQTVFFQDNPALRDAILGTVVLTMLFVAPNGLVRLGLIPRSARRGAAGGTGALDAPMQPASAVLDVDPECEPGGAASRTAVTPAAADAVAGDEQVEGDASLEAVDLTCRFGGLWAVKDVSFSVAQGEIVGLMGPNGAGKTTLLNMLSGVQKPTSGAVRIGGEDLSLRQPNEAAAAGIARTFQVSRIILELSVMENVLIGAHRFLSRGPGVMLGLGRGSDVREQRDRAFALLSLVGLTGHEDELAGGLAYGNQRRLEIARALMTRPRFILLDEPAAGMSPREGEELGDLLERLRGTGHGVVLIEHDMPLLMRVSDRVVALDHGEVMTIGTPEEVRRDPNVMRAYVGPMADEILARGGM
jgi:branched-chain amino acid transport system permease protein